MKWRFLLVQKRLTDSRLYSETSQTSRVELFRELLKNSILDAWLSSQYASRALGALFLAFVLFFPT